MPVTQAAPVATAGARDRARAGFAGWLFSAVHGRQLVYNQCWEDPALDRAALQLRGGDRVLAITSAGCNALDYVLAGAHVVATDVNPRQNHLLELKQAGIRALAFDDFFELFGRGRSLRAGELYAQLRPGLGEASRRFWDREIRLFDPRRARGGSFYYAGSSGLFAHAVVRSLRGWARLWVQVERLLAASSLDDQLGIYHGELRERLLGDTLLRLVGSQAVLSLVGVPAPQRRLVHAFPGGFPAFLRGCLDHVMSVGLLRDNYFWSVYLIGGYSRESCPEYLKADNFALLKRGLVDRVEIFTGSVTQCLSRAQPAFDAFVLLDHMDWLATRPALLEDEWRGIFRNAAPGARVIFRSGGADVSFLPVSILRRLSFERERADELHRRDRVGTYASFHIARLAAAF
jgi:S-adenosylmethionine-diacylglycerol 3-amino-3-carboxypropyl transferase